MAKPERRQVSTDAAEFYEFYVVPAVLGAWASPVSDAVRIEAGNKQRVQICLLEGIEYRVAEISRSRCKAQGKIEVEVSDGYAQFNEVHLNRNGVMG